MAIGVGTGLAISAGVGALGSIIGGKSSKKAATTAAGAQIEANQASIDFMDKWLEINRGDLKQAVDQGMVDINEAFGDAISTTETGTNAALNAINQAAYGTPYSEPGAIPVEEIIRSIPEMPPRQKITADMQKPVQPTTQTQPQTSGMNQSQLQQWAQRLLQRSVCQTCSWSHQSETWTDWRRRRQRPLHHPNGAANQLCFMFTAQSHCCFLLEQGFRSSGPAKNK